MTSSASNQTASRNHGVTVNAVGLVADPPAVVTTILPVWAPVGTSATIWLLEFTVKVVAATPPKLTAVVCFRLAPLIVTGVVTDPLAGVKV